MIRRHPLLSVVAGIYLAGLAWITLTPAPFGGARTALMARLAAALAENPATRWITAAGIEVASNIVLFVPFGILFIGLLGRRRWLGVLFASFIASCWIALAQNVWLPMRDSNPYFVLAHVSGCAIGIALAAAMTRHEAASRASAPTPVSNH